MASLRHSTALTWRRACSSCTGQLTGASSKTILYHGESETALQLPNITARHILIWPASTKYREAQLDPYAQLAERARHVLRPLGGSQCVLIVCGYRFRDAHINLELDRALRESARNLTIVAFTSDNEPSWYVEKVA